MFLYLSKSYINIILRCYLVYEQKVKLLYYLYVKQNHPLGLDIGPNSFST